MIIRVTGPHDLFPLEYDIHDQYYTDLVKWCEWAEKHPGLTEAQTKVLADAPIILGRWQSK